MESDSISEPVIELSDEEDEVTAPKSKGKPDRSKCKYFRIS